MPTFRNTEPAPPPASDPEIPIDFEPDEPARDPALDALAAALKAGPMTVEELCDRLDLAPAKLRALLERGRAAHMRVDLQAGRVGLRPSEEHDHQNPHVIPQPAGATSVILAPVGDVHFGSKYHLGGPLRDFCEHAYARGVRHFLQGGDLTDGTYKHNRWELTAHGFDEQCDVAIRDLPRWPDAHWWVIGGNHDETHGDNGMDVGAAMEARFLRAGRQDFHYVGTRGAYLLLKRPQDHRGVYVHLWHPRTIGAYARSYHLQKQVERYAPGSKPDILFAFHWHRTMYFHERGVHAFACGCFQGGQSSFGKSLGGSPDIGSWIVEYSLTEDGTIRQLSPQWLSYYEREEVRDVALG